MKVCIKIITRELFHISVLIFVFYKVTLRREKNCILCQDINSRSQEKPTLK
jgi:hypothetical protein